MTKRRHEYILPFCYGPPQRPLWDFKRERWVCERCLRTAVPHRTRPGKYRHVYGDRPAFTAVCKHCGELERGSGVHLAGCSRDQ